MNIQSFTSYYNQIRKIKSANSFQKQNNPINFKCNDTFEVSKESGVGTINHQTSFFREKKTDKFVQDYIRENFKDKPEINIVSGACSSGEEAYGYAILLDDIPKKIKITGFDISDGILCEAKTGIFDVRKYVYNPAGKLETEHFLFDDCDTDEYSKKCKEKFLEYFFPLTKKQLETRPTRSVNTMLKIFSKENIEETLIPIELKISQKRGITITEEEAKKHIDEQIRIYKNTPKNLQQEMFEVQRFKFLRDNLKNCSLNFRHGDILKLNTLFDKKEVDILLYRNALYHTLCYGNGLTRVVKEDAEEIMDKIAKQMNEVLPVNGLVVFGEKENEQGIKKELMFKVMPKNGFKPLYIGKPSNRCNIWQKTRDI